MFNSECYILNVVAIKFEISVTCTGLTLKRMSTQRAIVTL